MSRTNGTARNAKTVYKQAMFKQAKISQHHLHQTRTTPCHAPRLTQSNLCTRALKTGTCGGVLLLRPGDVCPKRLLPAKALLEPVTPEGVGWCRQGRPRARTRRTRDGEGGAEMEREKGGSKTESEGRRGTSEERIRERGETCKHGDREAR